MKNWLLLCRKIRTFQHFRKSRNSLSPKISSNQLYIVLCVRSPSRMLGILQSAGVISFNPKGYKIIASKLGEHATVLLLNLLNKKKLRQRKKNEEAPKVILIIFPLVCRKFCTSTKNFVKSIT